MDAMATEAFMGHLLCAMKELCVSQGDLGGSPFGVSYCPEGDETTHRDTESMSRRSQDTL